MQYVRAKTNDGRTIADFMLAVMADPNGKLDQRVEAAAWLADRAFGKPVQVLEHGGDPEHRAPIVLACGDSGGDQEAALATDTNGPTTGQVHGGPRSLRRPAPSLAQNSEEQSAGAPVGNIGQ